MKKQKKTRTPTEEKRHYRNMKYLSFGGMFGSVVLPFAIIGMVKFNDYFVEYDGVKMSIACVLAAALAGIAVFLVATKKVSNPLIVVLVGWYAVAFIFFLMGKVINDIAYIMFIGGLGIAGALGLDFVGKKCDGEIVKIDEAINEAKKEEMKEAYKEEVKEEKEVKKKRVRF